MNRNSDISTQISYWVIRLNISTLAKILFKNKKGEVERLTFIESGRPTLFIVQLLKKWGAIPFDLHKVKPRRGVAGPVLHLADVRNDKGAVVTLDIYRHILEIRRQISCLVMNSYKAVFSILGEKSVRLIHAWIGLQIAEEIAPSVYLAHYGRWKYRVENSSANRKNILVVPYSNWSSILRRNLQEAGLVDQMVFEKHRFKNIKKYIRLVLAVVQSIRLSLSRDIQKNESGPVDNAAMRKKIVAYYALGVDRELRNDIPFFYPTAFDFSRLLLYFKFPDCSPSASELKWFLDKEINCFSDPSISNTIRGIPEWRPTGIMRKERALFGRKYLKILCQVVFSRKGHSIWVLGKIWEMGNALAFMKDFFISNNVGVLVHSIASENNFIANLALSEVGGIAVDAERSIFFDYCTYMHNSPCHVRFVTGPYSAGQIPEPTFSGHTLSCGALSHLSKGGSLEGIELYKKDGRTILALFDEIPNDVFFGDSIEAFYRAALDLASSDSRFFLLIKTKKPRVLEKWPDIKKEIEQFALGGRCIFLDWKTTVSTACAHADMVLSLPSTAAFESAMSGTPTVIYNPMRAGSSLFYRNNGLNRRIFEEAETMVAAIKAFADGQKENVGDCSDIVSEIDPFGDGLGPERVGEYLKWCLEGFDQGMNRDEIIEKANESYSLKWGITHVIVKDAHGSM